MLALRARLAPNTRSSLHRPRTFTRTRRALMFATTGLLLLVAAGSSRAQTNFDSLYVADGSVYAAVSSGNTLYIGGRFEAVGPATGCGVPLSTGTGSPVAGYPKVVGPISAVVSDGSGGWFIGGAFTTVGGMARKGLAHILADNSVASWNPNPSGSQLAVSALALGSGIVYVGGTFSSIGGASRFGLAAIDVSTGIATSWNPGTVSGIAVLALSGSTLYVAGNFSSIGGQSRQLLGAVDTGTGSATAWNPSPNAPARALCVSGSTVYAGGEFLTIGGQNRSRLAALDATTGSARAWDPGSDGTVSALATAGGKVYVGGFYSTVAGAARNSIASVDSSTGAAASWNPGVELGGKVYALGLSGSNLYMAGQFSTVAGQPHEDLAAVDLSTAIPSAWDPGISSVKQVNAVALSGSVIFAGGDFCTVHGQVRHNLAALDLTTGMVTPWNPGTDSSVSCLLLHGGTLYAGGRFGLAGGQPHIFVAALDPSSGAVSSWKPTLYPNGFDSPGVHALCGAGDALYLGGLFLGPSRANAAAVSITTGSMLPWNPVANADVRALCHVGRLVYAGGVFTSIGGQARNHIAALDSATGLATAWNPDASYNSVGGDGTVNALAYDAGRIYAGGEFGSIGGLQRGGLAAIDTATAIATPWKWFAAEDDFDVRAILPAGRVVYAAFTLNNSRFSLGYLVALDSSTAEEDPWHHSANAPVQSLALSGSRLLVGGAFTTSDKTAHGGLVSFEAVRGPVEIPVPPVTISTLTHTFIPGPPIGQIWDAVTFPGGGYSSSGFAATIASGDTIKVRFQAPIGKKFVVHHAADLNNETFFCQAYWLAAADNGAVDPHSVVFENLHGVAPAETYSNVGLGEGGHVLYCQKQFSVGGDFDFTAMQFTIIVSHTIPVAPQNFGPVQGSSAPSWGVAAQTLTGPDRVVMEIVDATAAVEAIGPAEAFSLSAVTPNPASGSLSAEFTVAREAQVRLSLFDVQGREVAVLEEGRYARGRYRTKWDGSGRQLSSGIYFLRYAAGGQAYVRRVVVAH